MTVEARPESNRLQSAGDATSIAGFGVWIVCGFGSYLEGAAVGLGAVGLGRVIAKIAEHRRSSTQRNSHDTIQTQQS